MNGSNELLPSLFFFCLKQVDIFEMIGGILGVLTFVGFIALGCELLSLLVLPLSVWVSSRFVVNNFSVFDKMFVTRLSTILFICYPLIPELLNDFRLAEIKFLYIIGTFLAYIIVFNKLSNKYIRDDNLSEV